MRPLQEIARLRARVAVLEGQLAAAGLDPRAVEAEPDWALALSRQERALMGVLIGVAPRVLDAVQIDEALPHRDRAAERDLKLVTTLVSGARRKLGAGAIETVWGEGYRLGPGFLTKRGGDAPQTPDPR